MFHEKLRVQESVVRSANLNLRTLEEELRFIRMEVCAHECTKILIKVPYYSPGVKFSTRN